VEVVDDVAGAVVGAGGFIVEAVFRFSYPGLSAKCCCGCFVAGLVEFFLCVFALLSPVFLVSFNLLPNILGVFDGASSGADHLAEECVLEFG